MRFYLQCLIFGCLLFHQFGIAAPVYLGDLDDDGQATVLDVVRFNQHLTGTNPLDETLRPFADLNRDGTIDSSDRLKLLDAVLGAAELPPALPASLVASSPSTGEGGVAITRETILRFSRPLHAGLEISAEHVSVETGNTVITHRTHLSPDRQTLTLFYLTFWR